MNHKAALVLAADSRYFRFACIAAKQAIACASKPLPVVLIHDGAVVWVQWRAWADRMLRKMPGRLSG